MLLALLPLVPKTGPPRTCPAPAAGKTGLILASTALRRDWEHGKSIAIIDINSKTLCSGFHGSSRCMWLGRGQVGEAGLSASYIGRKLIHTPSGFQTLFPQSSVRWMTRGVTQGDTTHPDCVLVEDHIRMLEDAVKEAAVAAEADREQQQLQRKRLRTRSNPSN